MVPLLNILIIAESESEAQTLINSLHTTGYTPHFEWVKTAEAARVAFDEVTWDVVVSGKVSGDEEGVIQTLARDKVVDALEQERDLLSAILNTAGALIVMLNSQGQIVYFNRACEQLTGYTFEEVKGRPLWDLLIPNKEVSEVREVFDALTAGQFPNTHENHWLTKDGQRRLIAWSNTALLTGDGSVKYVIGTGIDMTKQRQIEAELKQIEWLLTKDTVEDAAHPTQRRHSSGKVLTKKSETHRLLRDGVGEDVLEDIVSDFIELLETSAAVYEKNGDYVLGLFTSGWCRFLDTASPELSHCHKSCWNEASKLSIEQAEPVDVPCRGGIRLYAVPVWAEDEIVGSMNFGYGNPPKDPATLQKIAARYQVDMEKLRELSEAYQPRPPFIVEIAKRRLKVAARLVGEIAKRKRAEEALRASEVRYRMVSELTTDYAYSGVLYPNNRLEREWTTEAFTRVTGYKLEQINAQGGWLSILHPDDRPIVEQRLANLRAGKSDVTEFRIITKGGTVRWLCDYAQPNGREGDKLRVIGAAQDITWRKRTEMALQESQKRLRAIFDNTQDAIMLVDGEGRFLDINPAASELTGHKHAELIEMTVEDIVCGKTEKIQESWQAFLEQGKQASECKLEGKDGSVVEVEYRAVAHIVPNVHLVVLRDITARRRAERSRQREFSGLAQLSSQPATSVTAETFGVAPLRVLLPDVFEEMVEKYTELIELALDQQTHKIDHNISDKLRDISETLGALKAGPRDIVEIHTHALRRKATNAPPQKAQAYAEEARLMVLELMGYLATYYRNYSVVS